MEDVGVRTEWKRRERGRNGGDRHRNDERDDVETPRSNSAIRRTER